MEAEHEYMRNAYNRIAEAYHAKRLDASDSGWNNYLEAPAMQRVLAPLCSDKDVLDLGCGTGILTAKVLEWGGHPRGMDYAEGMVAMARGLHPGVEFKVGDARSLPYEEATFDIVASSLVLHYIQDLWPVFSDVSRVLRLGGYFVFSIHHPFEEILVRSGDDRLRAEAKPYFNNEPYTWKMCDVEMLTYHHTLGDIINGLGSAGFVVCAVDECFPVDEAKENFDEYAYTSNYPPFCVFKARREA